MSNGKIPRHTGQISCNNRSWRKVFFVCTAALYVCVGEYRQWTADQSYPYFQSNRWTWKLLKMKHFLIQWEKWQVTIWKKKFYVWPVTGSCLSVTLTDPWYFCRCLMLCLFLHWVKKLLSGLLQTAFLQKTVLKNWHSRHRIVLLWLTEVIWSIRSILRLSDVMLLLCRMVQSSRFRGKNMMRFADRFFRYNFNMELYRKTILGPYIFINTHL